LIVSFWHRHTPYSVARKGICGVVSRTEAKSFALLTQPSLFIFCLRPIARRWSGSQANCNPPKLSHKNAQYIAVSLHSLVYHNIIRIYRLV